MGLLYNTLNRRKGRYKEFGMGHLFRVVISGLYGGDFLQASGLSSTLQTFEYREGGENSFVHHLPDVVNHGDVTLTKGVVRNDSDLWYWFRSYYQLEGSGQVPGTSITMGRPRFFRDITITDMSNNGSSLVVYKLYRAFVKAITVGAFDSMQSSFHVNSVLIGHHGLDAIHPIPTGFGNAKMDALLNEGVF